LAPVVVRPRVRDRGEERVEQKSVGCVNLYEIDWEISI
jgi:hypothetical protein